MPNALRAPHVAGALSTGFFWFCSTCTLQCCVSAPSSLSAPSAASAPFCLQLLGEIDHQPGVDDEDAGIVVQYNPGDELAVKVDGDTITYERNDEVIFTSEQKPVFPLVVSAAFCDRGARAAAIEMGLLLV